MEGIRRDSPSARALAAALGDNRFTLIDLGCSGGLDDGWRVFGDRLTAYAFDPGQHEVQRLRAAETRPEVHYVNAFVGLPQGHPLRNTGKTAWRTNPWARLAVHRTDQLHQAAASGQAAPAAAQTPRPTAEQLAYEAAYFEQAGDLVPDEQAAPADAAADQGELMRRNRWHEALLADPDQPVFLPDFLAREGVADIDFIKIDVDGPDFDILRSLGEAMDAGGVLGAVLEVNYCGSDNPHHNTFHNTDRFMRAHGFDLLDLSTRRYALAALPSPYAFEKPAVAQSVRGRPIQGDALYVRDFGYPSIGPDPSEWSDAKLIKSAAVCALFGLLDHAAEILLLHRERLSAHLDVDGVLDLLAQEAQQLDPEIDGDFAPFATYADYMAAFAADHPAFYGAEARRRINRLAPEQTDDVPALHRRIAELEGDLRAVTGSTAWRLTAPLRFVLARVLGRR